LIMRAKVKKAATLLAVFFSIILLNESVLSAQELTDIDNELSHIINTVSPSVVSIEARPAESKIPLFPGQNIRNAPAIKTVVGSGLLLDSLGHILTTFSLVEGNEEFKVAINNKCYDGRLIGADQRLNLAVLKIEGVFPQYIKVSDIPLIIGRFALAYGMAYNRTGYPTLGIIAGRLSDGTYLLSGSALPGILGGGVFDLSGGLIGIISSGSISERESGNMWGGIVMLPAEQALMAADKIICCGSRKAGYLGIETTSIEMVNEQGKVLGEAVIISKVEANSPAAKSGLHPGDIITGFAARDISSNRELQGMVASAGADSIVVIECLRNQQKMTMRVRLTSQPPNARLATHTHVRDDYGFDGEISPDMAHYIDSLRNEVARFERELDAILQKARRSR